MDRQGDGSNTSIRFIVEKRGIPARELAGAGCL
jgi:hypothetical protein